MINVYIMDNERSWMDRIRREFPWEESGCTLAGTASSIETAEQDILRLVPDMLVVDIDLPRMEWEPFFREVRRLRENMVIIVTTARKDFETARKAIELKVDRYLVKPMPMIVLIEAVVGIARRLEAARQREAIVEERARQKRDSDAFFRQKIIADLMLSQVRPDELKEAVEHLRMLGTNLEAKRYLVACCVSREVRKGGYPDVAGLIRALRDLAGEGVELAELTRGYLSILILGDGEEDLIDRAYEYTRNAMKYIASKGLDVRAGIGDPVETLELVRHSARVAQERLSGADDDVPLCGPREPRQEPAAIMLEPLRNLHEQLRYIAPDGLEKAFTAYTESIMKLGLPDDISSAFIHVDALISASKVVREHGGEPSDVLDLASYLMRLRVRSATLDFDDDFRLLLEALRYRAQRDDSIGNKSIARARCFLDANYGDPNLMLKDAAREAGMSSSRFSTLFAQETGVTFTEYVTRLRLSKARELLHNTNMRISQVAASVGYSDPHYFSWIFRKTEGMTPSECRDAAQGPRGSDGTD